jgi:CRP-like cAMP-binding protein
MDWTRPGTLAIASRTVATFQCAGLRINRDKRCNKFERLLRGTLDAQSPLQRSMTMKSLSMFKDKPLLAQFQGPEAKPRLTAALQMQSLICEQDLALELEKHVRLEQVLSGETLIRQGAYDNDLFMVLTGEFSVLINEQLVGRRGAGDHLGEMAVVDPDVPRSASVIAVRDSVVARITEPDFSKLADRFPRLWRRIAAGLVTRLRHSDSTIGDYDRRSPCHEWPTAKDPRSWKSKRSDQKSGSPLDGTSEKPLKNLEAVFIDSDPNRLKEPVERCCCKNATVCAMTNSELADSCTIPPHTNSLLLNAEVRDEEVMRVVHEILTFDAPLTGDRLSRVASYRILSIGISNAEAGEMPHPNMFRVGSDFKEVH